MPSANSSMGGSTWSCNDAHSNDHRFRTEAEQERNDRAGHNPVFHRAAPSATSWTRIARVLTLVAVAPLSGEDVQRVLAENGFSTSLRTARRMRAGVLRLGSASPTAVVSVESGERRWPSRSVVPWQTGGACRLKDTDEGQSLLSPERLRAR